MDDMDVDEDIFDFLPLMVKRCMIYHCRIYTSADKFSDFVITGGNHPTLYECVGKEIRSSLRLDYEIFEGVTWPTAMQNDDTDKISMKVYFSYKKRLKEPFYFLKIDKNLAILGQVDQQLTVYREFKQIDDYRICDVERSLGEPNVEIFYTNDVEPSESFELATLSYSKKGIDIRNSSGCCNEFDKITRQLRDRVSKGACELHEMDVQIQKECHEYMIQHQTIDQSTPNEDTRILIRYGDFWIRNVNNHVLIGVPVFNCSRRKNPVEKIRVFLSSDQRTQFIYTHKLYSFQVENASIEPINIQEICEQDEFNSQNDADADAGDGDGTATQQAANQSELNFNHEWTHQKQFVLYPDNAAIIIIKMDLVDFEIDPNGCEFNVIAMYEVFLENGSWKELQTHLATVKIDSDILHDKRYMVKFDTNKLYQDLLAIISTTERRFYSIKFDDELNIDQMQDLFENRFSFESISTTVYVEDNFRYFMSQNILADTMYQTEEDHRMYYCQQEHGYWSGTLIRIRTVKDSKANENEMNESYEMKIYNRDPIKINNLIKAIVNELGRKITIEPLTCYNRAALELELSYRFREESNALTELSKHLKYQTDKVQKSFESFAEAQYKTDCIWAELIKDENK